MEKLRKRYRTEKQRSVANPGRFSSSWVLFQVMESLENGSFSGLGAHPDRDGGEGVDFDVGFSVQTFSDLVSVPPRFPPKKILKVEKNSDHYFDSGRDSGTGYGVKTQIVHQNLIPQAFKFKGNSTMCDHPSVYSGFGNDVNYGSNTAEGFPIKTLGDRNLVPPGFRPKVNGTTSRNFYPELKPKNSYEVDTESGSHAKVFSNRDFSQSGFRSNNHDNVNGIAESEVNFGKSDEYLSLLRLGVAKKKCGMGNKRNVDPVAKMVSSIKLMGEEFMKVEMMKMEMAREMEKVRMEIEIKRCQFMVESQQQIMDAFANALSERKKKKKTKVKVELPDT